MAREEPLFYMVDNEPGVVTPGLSIRFRVPPINTTKYNQFMRDMDRLQWFAIGHGYDQAPETWTGKYEQEEYNCVLRYLNKFGWAPAKTCGECGTVVENVIERK